MKGYKTIDQFDLRECETFIKKAQGSQYVEQVKQQYARLCEEQKIVAQMKRQREQRELYEQAAKVSRRKTRNSILLAIFLVLALAAGILIYITYMN